MPLTAVFHVRVRPVSAERTLRVPFAIRVFVLDALGLSRDSLLTGGAARGLERLSVCGKALREHAVDCVSPSLIVLDYLVSNMGHRITCRGFRRLFAASLSNCRAKAKYVAFYEA